MSNFDPYADKVDCVIKSLVGDLGYKHRNEKIDRRFLIKSFFAVLPGDDFITKISKQLCKEYSDAEVVR